MTDTLPPPDERAAFQAWLRREYPLSWARMTAHETALMRDAWKGARAAAPAVQAPAGYVTAIAEGRVLMLPRPSLNTDGLVPLYAAAQAVNTDGVNASGDLDRIRVLHEQARKDRAASAVTGAPQGLVAPDSPGVAPPPVQTQAPSHADGPSAPQPGEPS
jgi:hypothetical protein